MLYSYVGVHVYLVLPAPPGSQPWFSFGAGRPIIRKKRGEKERKERGEEGEEKKRGREGEKEIQWTCQSYSLPERGAVREVSGVSKHSTPSKV